MRSLRRLATLTTLGLVSAGLMGIAAQPATAADEQVLHWGVSQYFNEHLTTQSFTDGATESDDGVVTFTGGVADGDTVHYLGAARYAFAAGGAELYSFTFSDLAVTVGDDGEGTIAADVSWTSPTGPGQVDDATLTTFSTDDDWSDGSLTATPDWLGVAPANTYGDGKPVDGASWAVDFVQAVPSSLNPFFYASGSANDAKKAPAEFTATSASAPTDGPAVTATPTYDENTLVVEVSGTGFAPVHNPPREDGVYVAIAPAGEFPETDDPGDRDKVAAAVWVSDAQITDGSFTVALDPANKQLDPRQSYSIYTWQAHAHTNASSDTETPITIDFSRIGSKAKLKATTKGKKLVVTVGSAKTAAGKVVAKLTKGKKSKSASAPVKKGVAKIKLPKLAKGKWKAKLVYTPSNAVYRSAKKKVTVKVS